MPRIIIYLLMYMHTQLSEQIALARVSEFIEFSHNLFIYLIYLSNMSERLHRSAEKFPNHVSIIHRISKKKQRYPMKI